ncbi:MAG: 2-oxoglutarate/2-oxoacid ferredoxin oxidoreductase subunit alpha [Clostridiales bacterium]|jgi:2-oxoglutarate ferredoxin oxidoreductase subunit alpha|nr:2-oxoglutarate/2-oxoacid ferredoxin oxidoreductase subunit alpha [Clostridiales bacterium]MDK2933462.1 2-oxoglutarate/2-oxoacid ferredoxin oxidoreductase subunit alpha [Clostridiales bacterium]
MDYNILLGGAAGQGMNTIGDVLGKVITRTGYYIFFNKDYMSRVRGGHNFNQLRFSEKPLYSHKEKLDVIIALNEETIDKHKERLMKDGIIVASSDFKITDEKIITLPFKEIAKEIGNVKVFGTVIVGTIIKMFNLSLDILEDVLKEYFSGEILEMNIQAAQRGYELTGNRFNLVHPNQKDRITINGNQAVGLGALAAGCIFFSGYPMTPGTGVMNYIASKQKELGIVVEQAEDEIAALNMVLGASFAGARAMTSTSGGGYSLMVEAIGLSGIIETPAVIVNVQRPGPATGLPTRTAQADLKFVINAAQDEIPRLIISLRHAEEAFYQTARAFNLAEKYQIPVTILSDQYLADTGVTIDPYDFTKIKIERYLATKEDIGEAPYKRYKITDSGISPRIIPGKIPGQVFMVDSDEHDEFGHIIESGDLRNQMMEKRMRKMELIAQDVQEPWHLGNLEPEVLLIAWGSTYGPIKEAVELLEKDDKKVAALVFGDVWPLPTKLIQEYSQKAKKIISIEGNYSGQLADVIQEKTCIPIKERLNKYDGRPWSYDEIYRRIQEVL